MKRLIVCLCMLCLLEAGCSSPRERIDSAEKRGDVNGLLKFVGNQNNAYYHRHAVAAVGRIGGAEAVEPLISIFENHEDINVRRAAASSLAEIGDARAAEPLVSEMKNGSLQFTLCPALVELGEPAVMPLINALKNGQYYSKSNVIKVLGQIGDARSVEVLIAELKSGEPKVQAAASEALVAIGQPSVEPLLGVMETEKADVKYWVITTLGQIKDARAIEALFAALRDDDPKVREAATEALIRTQNRRAVELARTELTNSDPDIRVKAVEILGWLGGCEEIDLLIAGLEDSDQNVREEAAWALQRVTGESFGEDRKDWQQWWVQNKEAAIRKGTLPPPKVVRIIRTKGPDVSISDHDGNVLEEFRSERPAISRVEFVREDSLLVATRGTPFLIQLGNGRTIYTTRDTEFDRFRPSGSELYFFSEDRKRWGKHAPYMFGMEAPAQTKILSPDNQTVIQSPSVKFYWPSYLRGTAHKGMSWNPLDFYTKLPCKVFTYDGAKLEEIDEPVKNEHGTLVGNIEKVNVIFDKDIARIKAVLPKAGITDGTRKKGLEHEEVGFTLVTIQAKELLLPYMKEVYWEDAKLSEKVTVYSRVPIELKDTFERLIAK